MSVFKDKQTNKWFFQLRYKDIEGKTKQAKRRGFDKKKDAQAAEREFLKQLEIERNKSAYITFEELANAYMKYSIGRKKNTTIKNQNNLIKTVLIPHFKSINIHKITPKDIDDFYNSVLNKYSNTSMKNIKRYLSAIMNFAVNFYELEKNIVNIVELPKKQETVKLKYWTLEQFQQFENALTSIKQKTLFNILFWSGMRKGEVLALRISDIDFKTNMITVDKSWTGEEISTVKNTSSERCISVPNHVIDLIKKLIKYKKDKYKYVKKTDYLFTAYNKPNPISPTSVNIFLKRGTEMANLPHIRVHYFRHSHASLLINAGVSLYVVSRHLGHSDIQTTANIYGHLYPNTESEIADVLNKEYEKINQKI